MSVTPPTNRATCPSCGRYVGPLDTCPHCGAAVRKRLPLRALRLACLVLALIGIGYLLFAVSGSAAPTVKIAAVAATMNYAYVRLEGTVTRGPLYDRDSQTLRFYLADDSGEMQAIAFRAVTRQLLAGEKIPTVGDHVSVEGALRIRDDFTSLNLVSADKLELTRDAATELALAELGLDDVLRPVRVRGDVREIRSPYQGLTLITLGDASGELDAAWTRDIEDLYGGLPAISPGDSLDVQGVVTLYRDAPQLTIRNPREVIILPEGQVSSNTNIKDLGAGQLDQMVRVGGVVTLVNKFAQGQRLTLTDDTGSIALVLWNEILAEIPNQNELREGARLEALGKLAQYRGEFEIIPSRASDVQLLPADSLVAVVATATPLPIQPTATARPTRTPTPAPIIRSIASLSTDELDRTVFVQGNVIEITDFSRGKYVMLQDASGEIQVVVFENVLQAIESKLKVGASMSVRGKVNVFRGELEVVADFITF